MEQSEKGMNKENDNSKQYEDSVINLFPQAPGASPMINHYNSPQVLNNQNNRRYGAYDSSPETTYYIWSYDGKLLAEYDTNGNCKKDYIYLGNKLIAEYKPQSGTYYYYMQDNTNSVRIITNNTGTVVYSSAYGPYGDSLKTWVNTYNPKLKYSTKQRENWSDIDYFGARYYSNEQFRFTSPDPVMINKERTYKPWLLNLYAYTRNNPMSYVDMDGRVEGNNWKMLMSNGGGWDKVNPKEFRRVMTIPLLAAGAIAGAGISWSLGWAYTPEIIAAGNIY